MMKNYLLKIGFVGCLVMALCSMAYAEDANDATSGPGVGMSESSWNGQGKIYTFGNNGIEGYVSEANAAEVAPTTVESNIVNPINNYAVDMGPTTAEQWQLSLHRIEDGGPGTNLDASIIMPPTIYNNVGPGANIPKSDYVDKGPIYEGITTANVDPANALKDWGPASSTEGYTHKKAQ